MQYAVEIQHNCTTTENSQAIKVLQLSKFFREITRQVVAGDVTVHLKNSSGESYGCTLLEHITKDVHLHYLDTS
jgi:hypothetical protein